MEGKRIEWFVFDELEHLEAEYYKSLRFEEIWLQHPMGLDAYKPMEIDPDLSRRQAMDRIQTQIENLEERILHALHHLWSPAQINRLKNEQRELKTQWDNLRRQEPKRWSPAEQRPQQEQTEKCVIYYIGGPWDMVKKIEEKKPTDAAFVDVVEHASYWDGRDESPRMQRASYKLTQLQTLAPICDGLPVFAAVYTGIE